MIKKFKNLLRKMWLHLKAETPKVWNWVAGLAATVPVLVAAINEATTTVIVPQWYTNNLFYILGVSAIIAFYAKTRTTEAGKEQVQKNLNP